MHSGPKRPVHPVAVILSRVVMTGSPQSERSDAGVWWGMAYPAGGWAVVFGLVA